MDGPNPQQRTQDVVVERRRSQRVQAFTPVEIAWQRADGAYVKERGETECVSAHGGAVKIRQPLSVRQVVELIVDREGTSALARVMHCSSPASDGLRTVGLELAVPSDTFWGIGFYGGL